MFDEQATESSDGFGGIQGLIASHRWNGKDREISESFDEFFKLVLELCAKRNAISINLLPSDTRERIQFIFSLMKHLLNNTESNNNDKKSIFIGALWLIRGFQANEFNENPLGQGVKPKPRLAQGFSHDLLIFLNKQIERAGQNTDKRPQIILSNLLAVDQYLNSLPSPIKHADKPVFEEQHQNTKLTIKSLLAMSQQMIACCRSEVEKLEIEAGKLQKKESEKEFTKPDSFFSWKVKGAAMSNREKDISDEVPDIRVFENI